MGNTKVRYDGQAINIFQLVWIAENRALLKKVHLELNEPTVHRSLRRMRDGRAFVF